MAKLCEEPLKMKPLQILVITLAFVNATRAYSKDICPSNYWRPEGQVMEAAKNYDKLATEIVFEDTDKNKNDLEKSKDTADKLNAFKERFGYPIYSMITDRSRQVYKDRMVGDGMGGGLEGLVFLRNLNLSKESTGIGLDIFNEIEQVDSEQPIRTWKIPFEADVAAIDGENLIAKHDVAIICANNTNEPHKSVLMEIKKSGNFKFIPDFPNKLPEVEHPKFYEGFACRGSGPDKPYFVDGCKTYTEHTEYATGNCKEAPPNIGKVCGENIYTDLKTKTKHFTFHTYIGPEGNYH